MFRLFRNLSDLLGIRGTAFLGSVVVFATPVRAQMSDPAPRTEQQIDWEVGEIRADPVRNVVYLLDETDHRILALNTATGQVDASVVVDHSIRGGYIEFSPDGTKLFVSTPDTNHIFAFATATLAPLGSIELTHSVSSFVMGGDGFFYTVARTGYSYRLLKIDSVTGALIGESSTSGLSGFTCLVRNAAGNRFFVTLHGVSGGSGSTKEFSVTAGQMPSLVATHFPDTANEAEVVFDEDLNRLYRSVSSGVGVWDIATSGSSYWPFGASYSVGVAHFPGSNVVVGASGSIYDGVIRKFNRTNGSTIYDYPYSSGAGYLDGAVVARGLETTANGHIVYVKKDLDDRYSVGLIGYAGLTLPAATPPNPKPQAENELSWRVGDMTGDPSRNLVYIVDETNWKLIAFNTQTGNTDADVDIPVDPTGGKLALSLDNATLYLSAPSSRRILSFSAGSAPTPGTNLALTVPIASFVVASDGYFYGVDDGDLLKIDPATGAVSGSLNGVVYPTSTLTRRDETGTRLYLVERGLSGGSGLDEYEIRAGAMPAKLGARFDSISNDQDLSVDRGRNRIYRASGGAYGIGSYDLEKGVENFWPFGAAYGKAVAQHPGLPGIFGASGGELILEFDKDTAKILGTYDLSLFPSGYDSARVIEDRLEMGGNGISVYARITTSERYFIGSIGLGSISLPRKFIMPPPPTVTGVSASDGTSTDHVVVYWDSASGADLYSVFRNTTNNSGTASIVGSGISSTVFSDATVVPGTTYYYWVKAFNSGGSSNFSASNSGYALYVPPPSTVTGVTASDGTFTDRVTVSWQAASGASTYNVYRNSSNQSGAAAILASGRTITSFTDWTADPGATYYYWVRAFNSVGNSGFSASDSGYARNPPPAPTSLSATDGVHDDSIVVTWSAVPAAEQYRVYISTSADGPYSLRASPLASITTYTDTSAARGTVYHYRVESWTAAGGVSSPSPSDSGYRKIPNPSGLKASDGYHRGETRLTWQGVSGAAYYAVYRGSLPDGSNANLVGSTIGTTFTDADGLAGTVYHYFVVTRIGSLGSSLGPGDSGYGTVDLPFRPDGKIGLGTSGMNGDQIYGKGPSQELRQKSKKLRGLRWYVAAENDGETGDSLVAQLTGGNRFFPVSLRTIQGGNVTAQALAGSLSLSLQSGVSENFLIDTKPSKAARGKRKRMFLDFTLRSETDGTLTDTVTAMAETVK
jgi:fibronectin type 3 domain-containing protein